MGSDVQQPQQLSAGNEVLAVEDDPRVRKMLDAALKEMAFVVTFAPSAEAASRLLADKRFDIMILDLNLPGVSGIEFLEQVRKQDNDIQVIIMTGFGDLDAARKAIHFDVVEFLTKPCALGTLEAALSKARARRKGQVIQESRLHFDEDMTRKIPRLVIEESSPAGSVDEGSMEAIERKHILAVLAKNNGNRAAAAAELGISVRKLYYRLGEYQRKGLLA